MSVVIMGTYHTKGSQSTPKNNLDLLGVCVCVFLFVFSPLLLGHMLLTRVSAQEKRKEYRAMGMGTRALEEVLDERDEQLGHRVTRESNR